MVEVAGAFGAHHLVLPCPTWPARCPAARWPTGWPWSADRPPTHGLTVGFEFLPWTPVRTLEDAAAIVTAVDRPEVGLTVDFWHLTAGGAGPTDLARLPGSLIAAVHLTDGHRDPSLDPLSETMVGRRLPGDGEFDMVELVRALDATGSVVPISVETVSLDHRRLTVDELAVLVEARFAGRPGRGPGPVRPGTMTAVPTRRPRIPGQRAWAYPPPRPSAVVA